MEETDFRAWDKQTGDWVDLYYADYTIEWYNPRCKLFRSFFDKHLILMQYTGLNDKNKTGIYEGDILKFDNGNVRTVFRVKGGYATEVFDTDVGKYYEMGSYCPIMSLADEQGAGYIEQSAKVIGNIYDNPEQIRR